MPNDPKTVGFTHVPKGTFGAHDLAIQAKYEAPAGQDGLIDTDTFKLKDFEAAKAMSQWLQREYPGHFWACISDIRQGIVRFNIPVLMGLDKWYVVNLHTHDIIDGMRRGAGEILERYRLKRGRFVLDEFLEALTDAVDVVLCPEGLAEGVVALGASALVDARVAL